MIIDCHTHLGTFNKRLYSAKDLISSMDDAGIDYSLLISIKLSPDHVGITVDEAVEISKKYPRLKPIGHLNFRNIDKLQIKHLKDLLAKKQIYGIKFYPGYEDYYPNDEKLLELYSYCEQNNFPVIFHTGALLINQTGHLKQSHPINIDEVASRFPNLKIVMAHMGNPWLIDCAAIIHRHKNVYVDISGYFEEFSDISAEEVKGFVNDTLKIKDFVGSFNKFIFGTDYPMYSQKQYLEAVRKISFTEDEKELVFWKNANEIFNLKLA